jgi:hypothetical protein
MTERARSSEEHVVPAGGSKSANLREHPNREARGLQGRDAAHPAVPDATVGG